MATLSLGYREEAGELEVREFVYICCARCPTLRQSARRKHQNFTDFNDSKLISTPNFHFFNCFSVTFNEKFGRKLGRKLGRIYLKSHENITSKDLRTGLARVILHVIMYSAIILLLKVGFN